jgi:hypothetical protein
LTDEVLKMDKTNGEESAGTTPEIDHGKSNIAKGSLHDPCRFKASKCG